MDGHSGTSRYPTIAQTRICHHHCCAKSINPPRTAPRAFVYARWDKVLSLKCGILFAVSGRRQTNTLTPCCDRGVAALFIKLHVCIWQTGGNLNGRNVRVYPMSSEPYVRFTMFFASSFLFSFSFPLFSFFEECF